MNIVDLTVPIGASTFSPPSVNRPIGVDVKYKEPGFWQVTSVSMALHAGSHVDFSRHHREDGESADEVDLNRVCGPARLIDLGELDEGHVIAVADLEAAGANELDSSEAGIVLIRTHWTDRGWGEFPRYYLGSPSCDPAAAAWLVGRGFSAIGFDCFPEGAAKKTDYSPLEFEVHRIIGDGGAILMQQLTNLSSLPTDRAFSFFGPFLKFEGGEGAPARFFATVD